MNEAGFSNWLKAQGYDSGTINARVSNCLRVCKSEGDLDTLYRNDKLNWLIDKLTYSTSDEKNHKPVKHTIMIKGNQRKGTATLKQAVNLYIRFLESEEGGGTLPAEDVSDNSSATLTPDKNTTDSYALFLHYFVIDKDTFYSFGLENTILADRKYISMQWKTIKEKLLNNQRLYIRSYGRQGKNTELFIGLYQFIFGNFHITQDPSNNMAAKRNLQEATNLRINQSLYNFQCAHIFGCTKNPLMFEGLWNICFIPKIFDPLTGHETKGNWPKEYQSLFKKMIFNRHVEFISDYNHFIREQDVLTKIDRYINAVKEIYDKKLLSDFRQDAKREWTALV